MSRAHCFPLGLAAVLLLITPPDPPAAAQLIQHASVGFEFNADNRRAPNRVELDSVLPRGTGEWVWCLYGVNTANKQGKFKYSLQSYAANRDTPPELGPRFHKDKGIVEVESRETSAYGQICYGVDFGTTRFNNAVIFVTVTTKSTRKQPAETRADWGVWARPLVDETADPQPNGPRVTNPAPVPIRVYRLPD